MADIVDTLAELDSYSALLEALEKADLIGTMRGPGPYTVFAPDDDAFARVGDDTMQLLYDNIPSLRQVLLYHVLPGVHRFEDLRNGAEMRTVQGDTVLVRSNADAYVNNAKIFIANVDADNGVIHLMADVVLSKVEAGL